MTHDPIDAVITWVDGGDPKHAAKLNDYLQSIGAKPKGAASSARFHNAGEIDYCVTSILKYAPWIRTIYIVTDDQQPELMNQIQGGCLESRVRIVDHSVIFAGYEHYLPTFNSNAILALLWRIPGLSEQFVFFNDDFFLVNPVRPEDFFCEGKPVLRGKWYLMQEYLPHKWLRNKIFSLMGSKKQDTRLPGHRISQEIAAGWAGFKGRYFRLPHVPHAWQRSTLANFYDANPHVLQINIETKLRSHNQYIVEALAAHLEIKANKAVFDKVAHNVHLKPGEQSYRRIRAKLKKADNDPQVLFACVQSIETASEKKQKMVFSWLDKRIGSLDALVSCHASTVNLD